MEHDEIKTPEPRKLTGGVKVGAAMVLAGAIGLAIGGMTGRVGEEKKLTLETQNRVTPTVLALHLSNSQSENKLVLPGALEAYYSAPIYARVNGYLKHWYIDIGQPVRAGQVLADIETPELDDQLNQALAALDTAKAHLQLADITAQRWQAQLKEDAVSQQEADEKTGSFTAKKAEVAAAQANVDRLRSLQSFRSISAPFAGIVTARNTDIGALINAGAQSGKELFTVADVHALRLYVSVPQAKINALKPGVVTQLTVPEHPTKIFDAKLVSTSKSIDTKTGMVLVELDVDNSARDLLPGDYAEVTFNLSSSARGVMIPASALMLRKTGPQVALLTADSHVTFKPIVIARDLGVSVEVASGVAVNDTIIDNPSESLVEGQVVKVLKPETAAVK